MDSVHSIFCEFNKAVLIFVPTVKFPPIRGVKILDNVDTVTIKQRPQNFKRCNLMFGKVTAIIDNNIRCPKFGYHAEQKVFVGLISNSNMRR